MLFRSQFKMWLNTESIENPLDILNSEVWFTYARSGGPGGQNVNKVNSKAVLGWDVAHSKVWNGNIDAQARFAQMFKNHINKNGLVVLSSQNERDQVANKNACINKLKMMVQQALVEPVERVETQPTFGSQQRRMDDKRANHLRKQNRRFVPGLD